MHQILCDILLPLCQAADATAQQSNSFMGLDTMGAGGAAAALGGVWFFFRVIRKIVATLFMLCVVYLVAKCCWGVDISSIITPLFHAMGG